MEELQEMGCYPTWIPKGFEFYSRDDYDMDGAERAYINLFNGDRDLSVGVHEVSQYSHTLWSVNGDSIERYHHNGQTYYVFRNIDRYGVCWIRDGLECCIAGMVSVREIKKMIHSLN